MQQKLKRSLGLLEVTFYGVGVIVGAGIYALIGKAAGLAGNMVWAAFGIGALIAAFTGLSYAELSSMFPKAGGEYVYLKHAFSRRLAFLIGWLIVFGGVVTAAAVALGFSGYFSAIFHTPLIPIALALIVLLSLINFWGIRESAIANMIATIVELAGLALVIVFGLKYFGSVDYLALPSFGFTGVMSATALIFFAYLGFEDIVRLSEETKNPKRTIPMALVLSIIISTILYISVAIAAVSVVGWEKLAASDAPLALVAQSAFGAKAFFVLAVIALFATLNTVLVTLVATSRMLYGMADEHGLPKIFCSVHDRLCTPWFSIIVTGGAALVFTLIGKIEIVASLVDFALFVTFALVNAALIWLRHKLPKMQRPFKTWAPLAWLGVIFSLGMLFYLDKLIIAGGVAMVVAGLLVYEAIKKRV